MSIHSAQLDSLVLVFSVFADVIAAVFYVVPEPPDHQSSLFNRSCCAWLRRTGPLTFCMWYVLFVALTILVYTLRIVHDDDEIGTVYAATLVVSLVFSFIGMIWPKAGWDVILSLLLGAAVSKFLTVETVIHTTAATTVFIVGVLVAASCASGWVAAKLTAIQYSIMLSASLVLSSMYLRSQESIWIGDTTRDAGMVIGLISGFTVFRLFVSWVCGRSCCRGLAQEAEVQAAVSAEEEEESALAATAIIEMSTPKASDGYEDL